MKKNNDILEYLKGFFDKYKYPVLVFVIGLLLIVSDGFFKGGSVERVVAEKSEDLLVFEQNLKHTLEQIEGVGRVEVTLSLNSSERNVYAKDSRKDNNEEIVVINESGTQKALLEYSRPATYRGAVVVCDGGDNSRVKLVVTEAVKALTGIGIV